jgi:ABC-2 type transport system permease protein
MRSKTSCFNRALFFHTLKRFWPLWAGYLLIWLLLLLMVPDALRYPNDKVGFVIYDLPRHAYESLVILRFFAAILPAMAVFSHLYQVKSADFTASLPLRRECQFLTLALAGIVCTWLADLIVFALAAGIEASSGVLAAGLPYLLQLLAISFLLSLFFYGLAVLCAQFTGHLLALPAAYILLSFAVVVMESIVREIMQRLVFGLQSTGLVLQFLSPPAFLLDGVRFSAVYGPTAADGSQEITGAVFGSWLWVGVYAAVGVLFLLAALALYRRRRMETAGDFVALRVLKPIFKYCFAVGCALVLSYVVSGAFYSGDMGSSTEMFLRVLVSLLAGAFLGYFAAEMLIRKSFRVFCTTWRGFAVLAVLLAVLTFAVDFNAFGLETRLPDTAAVSRAVIRCDNGKAILNSPQGIADTTILQSGIVGHKKTHEAAAARRDQVTYVSITYYDADDGILLQRRYYIASDSADRESLRALVNSPEAIENRWLTEIPVTEENLRYTSVNYYDPETQGYQNISLNPNEAYALYAECLRPDIADSSLGYIRFYPEDYESDTAYAVNIELDLVERQPDGSYTSDYINITLTTDAARTVAWMRSRGIPLVSEQTVRAAEYDGKYATAYAAPAIA